MASPRFADLDVEDEEATCQGCYHSPAEHLPTPGPEREMTFPCGAEERFDVGDDGRMVLIEEPCECEDYRKD